MYLDVVDLREFYATPLGRASAISLDASLAAIWPVAAGDRIAGLGYTLPWLDRWRPQADRALSLMPATLGALQWPAEEKSLTALVHGEQLPLGDSSLDRLLLVHALEHSEDPSAVLSEAWRVLTPGGRLLIVVPNRTGLWARIETTPFGAGRPFSRGQLSRLLREALLTPTVWSDALHFPPMSRRGVVNFHVQIERLGKRFWPAFSGVIMVEATKRLFQGLPAARRASRPVLVPVLAPQAASRARRTRSFL